MEQLSLESIIEILVDRIGELNSQIEDLQDELLFLKPVETSDFIPPHVQPTVKKRDRPPGSKNKKPAPKKRGRPAKKAS
jgi:hypothetical protein